MKITVQDVINSEVNIRDYMLVGENGRIFVDGASLGEVLIDKSEEWDELKKKNKQYLESVQKAVAHFNQDEHQEGMSELQKALRGKSE